MVNPDHPLNATPFTRNFPQPVNIQSFQQAVTQVFGREGTTRRPWVRCVWAGSDRLDDAGLPEAMLWDQYGRGGRGEWRRRYLYSSSREMGQFVDEKTGLPYSREVWTDISPARFVLERFIPPDVALAGWKPTGRDRDGDLWTDRMPAEGLYVPLETNAPGIRGGIIAHHDGHCCRAADISQSICYGWYAEPGELHLNTLRQLVAQINALPERRPGPITHDELANAAQRSAEAHETLWTDIEHRIQQRILDATLTHSAMLSEDPSVRHHGKYHFLSAHSRSGLPAGRRIVLTDE